MKLTTLNESGIAPSLQTAWQKCGTSLIVANVRFVTTCKRGWSGGCSPSKLKNAQAVQQAAENRLKNGLATLPEVLEARNAAAQAQYCLYGLRLESKARSQASRLHHAR